MSPSDEPANRDRPWWIGVVVIAIGAFWTYGAMQLPQTATYARIGPGMFVTAAGLGLIFFGLLLLIQIARGERFEAQDAEDIASGQAADWAALAMAVAAASVPLYTMERFGFVVTAALMFVLTTRAFGSRRILVDCAIGMIIAAVAWYGFNLLGVNLGDAVKVPKTAAELLPSLKPW